MAAQSQARVVARVQEIAERVAASEGIEIVEVELTGSGNRRVLRITLDKPGGICHDDCEKISNQVGAILDVEDVVPGGRYTLEVSSPGVERKLLKPADYERFAGEKVCVSLREPVENSKYWEGRLLGIEQGQISVEVSADRTVRFAWEQVAKAHLKFEW